MPTQPSYNSVLALYFALMAARKGTTKVVISNERLKAYFIGNRKGERLSEKQLTDFASKLRPVFPRSKVTRDQRGPKLFLYLNEQPDSSPSQAAPVWFIDEATMRKTLGLG